MAKILIIDDDVLVLDLLEEFLSKNGFDIVRAFNGSEAMDILRYDKSIDLLILDRKMPIIDGLMFINRFQEENKSLPMIFMTGSITKEAFFNEVKDLGVVEEDIFTKPLDLYALLNRINEKLEDSSVH